ncbi:bifunctional folylpolyglutamate synthase/dihydrofolate synthase [Treponema socranskii]|uniref:bifunctional folylpolyglutamate synthase/dihydrofolate synthase n=1 Tax=Treponema socranskii TaxID=53419 RepID=UPI003D8B43A6
MEYAPSMRSFERWLDSFINFEKLPQKNMFWLDTMRFFCERLGHPEASSPCIHIAGSKGKGSVSKMIACILQEAGFSVGLYTSPHVSDFRERIATPGGFFEDAVYSDAAAELKDAVQSDESEKKIPRTITWFELVTLYAFLCFRRARTDWNVFEVGLGGRLDATNVVTPKLCCITPIELEHTEYLGDTLEKIASEKAGIIKPRIPVIVSHQTTHSVYRIFQKNAQKLDTLCTFLDDMIQFQEISYTNDCRMNLCFESPLFSRPVQTTLRMLGSVQAQNAAQAALAVKTALPSIDEAIIEKGLAKASLPARFEIIPYRNAVVVFDGAHTVLSMQNTLDALTSLFPSRPRHLLFALAADKNAEAIVPLFCGLFHSITLTKPGFTKHGDIERAEAACKSAHLPFTCESDFEKAVQSAFEKAEAASAVLLVSGSFYLAADAKRIIHFC